MVIYSDSLIFIDFDPKTDILWVKWPHLVDEPMVIVKPAIGKILEAMKYFNATKLLVDTKNTNTNIPEDEFKRMSKEFVSALSTSDLKKVARVVYAEPVREIRAKILLDDLAAWLEPNLKIREFQDVKSAFAWLESEEV
jgi:hypothetical protein